MDKFVVRIPTSAKHSSKREEIKSRKEGESSEKQNDMEFDEAELPADPALRPPMSTYHPNVRESIRRAYLLQGPCQPRNCDFQPNHQKRKFNPKWFDEYKNWLEYSPSKHRAYCQYCYLFRPEHTDRFVTEAFVSDGFNNWKEKKRFDLHIGGPNSYHNVARMKCTSLMQQKKHISTMLQKQSDQQKNEYQTRLWATVNVTRILLMQGLPFRGHDESEPSFNRGNFIEILKSFAKISSQIDKVVLKNAPENNKLTSPDIQKDITRACAIETTNAIMKELGGTFFSILLDDSRDISTKEQMAIVLRFVNKKGQVVERFLALVHVLETSAISLKAAVEETFCKYGLSIASLRGQGYDGASNMKGAFNGLKTLILNKNESAYYIHCFAHQLQLALVAVAEHHPVTGLFFGILSRLSNFFSTSCKRSELIREAECMRIAEALELSELETGRGLNQEMSLIRPGDTRWSSHYDASVNLVNMYPSVIKALDFIAENISKGKWEALDLIRSLRNFEFIFGLHLMYKVLGITDTLSQALQRKDQDIVNAMNLVIVSKTCLQDLRDNGWDSFMSEISIFCNKFDISVPDFIEIYTPEGRPRRGHERITFLHHYRVEVLFYAVIDMQLQELNSRFTEANTELLLSVACLSPKNSFSAFDKHKLIRLDEFYPKDFNGADFYRLESQLDVYLEDMKTTEEFSNLKSLTELSEMMVTTGKHIIFSLVYLLIKLALTLPVATASVERAFSAMNIIKTRLRNKMGDEWVNDALVTYIERNTFDSISDEAIMHRFQNMKNRRGHM